MDKKRCRCPNNCVNERRPRDFVRMFRVFVITYFFVRLKYMHARELAIGKKHNNLGFVKRNLTLPPGFMPLNWILYCLHHPFFFPFLSTDLARF